MKYFILILLLITLASSCKKEEKTITKNDYVTFGSFHGECMGDDCIILYTIAENKLYEDPNDLKGTKIGYLELSNEKYIQVKDLVDDIPPELIMIKERTFGCPDCVDQGGLYLKYSLDGKNGEFRIDVVKDNIPPFLHSFKDKMKEKINLLK